MKLMSGFFLLESLLHLRLSQSFSFRIRHRTFGFPTTPTSLTSQDLSFIASSKRTTTAAAATARKASNSANNGNDMSSSSSSSVQQHRILCYGDSLTAGTSDSPYEMYPYAPHLERAMMTMKSSKQYVVRHRGMPGWTADAMLDAADDPRYGLRSAIKGIENPSLSCVIIMAGTNDLGYAMALPSQEERCNEILQPIVALHEMAWENGVPQTMAIGIPPSGYQSQVSEAANLAKDVNAKLQHFCQSNNRKASFVPFPFPYERGGQNWASDTLHFSPQGYQALGEYLANPLLQILDEMDS